MVEITSIIADWYISTLFFYVTIIILGYLCACYGKNKIIKIGKVRSHLDIVLLGILMLAVKGFSITGRDIRAGYYYNFVTARTLGSIYDQSLEIGYKVLNVIIYNLTHNYYVLIFVVAVLTISPFLYLLNKYRNEIDTPLVVLAYLTIYFFSGFSPIRNFLAASIAMLVFDAICEKKKWKAIFLLLISISFHTSMVILLIPYFFCFARKLQKKEIFAMLGLIFITIFTGKNWIFGFFMGSDRYSKYANTTFSGFGLEQIAYYLPIFYLIWKTRNIAENYRTRVSISYAFTGFVFGMLGYVVTVFGRTQTAFMPLVFVIGYHFKMIESNRIKNKYILMLFMTIYCAVRFWLYISQYYNLEDIMPYTNIFGMTI